MFKTFVIWRPLFYSSRSYGIPVLQMKPFEFYFPLPQSAVFTFLLKCSFLAFRRGGEVNPHTSILNMYLYHNCILIMIIPCSLSVSDRVKPRTVQAGIPNSLSCLHSHKILPPLLNPSFPPPCKRGKRSVIHSRSCAPHSLLSAKLALYPKAPWNGRGAGPAAEEGGCPSPARQPSAPGRYQQPADGHSSALSVTPPVASRAQPEN